MSFAAIHVPNFMVQAVVRAAPALGLSPLALIEGAPPLETVVAANRAARKTGIRLGMTKSQAAQFCGAAIHPRSPAQENASHAALLDVAWSVSPRVEDTAPDTLLLDLAGLASLFGSEEQIAAQLAQRAAICGLAAQVAVAANLDAAFHAARGFPASR